MGSAYGLNVGHCYFHDFNNKLRKSDHVTDNNFIYKEVLYSLSLMETWQNTPNYTVKQLYSLTYRVKYIHVCIENKTVYDEKHNLKFKIRTMI